MKIRHLNTAILFLIVCACNVHAQVNCTVPLSPVLLTVSVQPETGKTDFTWLPSESTDIAAYILYSFSDGDGTPIDTVWNPLATSFTITNTAPKYSSVSYVVAAHRRSAVPGLPGCTSPLSNDIATIFSQTAIDTCNNRIFVSWNSYKSVPKIVTGYSVMVSVDQGEFTEAILTGPDINSFTLDNFITNAAYCFYIRANLEGNMFSTSNKSCILTKMQRPPLWINADYATVNPENKVSLSFTIDPLSEIKDYSLKRKTGQSGLFQEIAKPVSVNGTVLYTDDKADINVINYYTLSAINSCDLPVKISNVCSNMVLKLDRRENDLLLSWNSYRKWMGHIASFQLFTNTGNGFEEQDILQPDDTLFTVKYSDLMYDVSGKEVCFYIRASETGNPYGVSGLSSSSGVCIPPVEMVTVPNVFTPNKDLKNDLFRPILSFTPVDYHLVISDQHGKVLFETKDYSASWDGYANGKEIPNSVCLWFLRVTTPSGNRISRTGTITIYKDR